MKNLLLLLLVLIFIPLTAFSQIPNYSFENWSGGNPDGWTTNNISGFLEPVTQSTDAYAGNSAAKMEMMTALSSLLQPVLNAGPLGVGIPVSQRHSTISFYYKYSPTTSSVSLVMSVGMYKNSQFIGVGVASTKIASGSFTKLTASITYYTSDIPDAATIYVTLIDSLFNPSTVGSYAIVDDFYFDQATEIKNKESKSLNFCLAQNYPNPFNSTTKITWQSPAAGWHILKVYNLLGVEVATLVNEFKPAGSYDIRFDAADLPGGVYFYRLNTGNYTSVKKMILLK